MKKWLLVGLCVLALSGCRRYEEPEEIISSQEETTEAGPASAEAEAETPAQEETESEPERVPVKVKGIYLSGPAAGSGEMMDGILSQIQGKEINAVVIDLKDDNGRVTCAMDSPMVTETEASRPYVADMPELIRTLKEDYGLYVIARVVAFRDPWLAEKKPEWCLKLPDGSVFRDRSGLAWINPYKEEVWDYLVEIGTQAAAMGFDEVQFDYIRFCTEKGVGDVVFDEADTRSRSKTDVITEFTEYAYDRLAPQGIYVAADVFGAIIGSEVDSQSVGQVYEDMAKNLDYICPMIYPSHYSSGNFGIEHPDTQPYETVLGALQKSRTVLDEAAEADDHVSRQAIVRPWLQDFTASYLGEGNYIPYGDAEVAAQIQAVKDAGYDEWMLWSAANRYHFGQLAPAGSEHVPEESPAEQTSLDGAEQETESVSLEETAPESETASPDGAEQESESASSDETGQETENAS